MVFQRSVRGDICIKDAGNLGEYRFLKYSAENCPAR